MSLENRLSEESMGNIVENYGWTDAEGPYSCSYTLPKILSVLKQLGVYRVVDIGAGNGKLCYEASRAGFQVVGVEYDKAGVEVARSTYPAITFYKYGIQDDPALLLAQEKKFDAVVSTDVIEHLFSPHLLPLYAGEILKEEGYLVISTPYHGYLKNLAISILHKWDSHHTTLWHGGHIKFWSRSTISQLFRENGFNVIGFFGVGRMPFLWKSMIVVGQKT